MKNFPTGRAARPLILLLSLFVTGCAAPTPKPRPPVVLPPVASTPIPAPTQDAWSGLAGRLREKALRDEEKGDLPQALKKWEIVNRLQPPDRRVETKIADLKQQIPAAAERHFQKGCGFLQSRSHGKARKEFLQTLYLQPDHAEALWYVKERLRREESTSYEVKKGDTLKGIAKRVYGDPRRDVMIAYLNELKIDAPLEPATILKMPAPETNHAKKTAAHSRVNGEPADMAPEMKGLLGRARTTYRDGNYQESAALTQKLLEYDPASRESRELMNASFYHWGKQLSHEGKYDEALKAFRRIDPAYRDVGLQLAHARKQSAEAHYKMGVKLFIEEEIEKAIQEWESTLAMEPNHPKAKKDIENGRHLLKKLEKIK